MKKTLSPERVLGKLRRAEALVSQGKTVLGACQTREVREPTTYRGRSKHAGMGKPGAKRSREQEKKGSRLKKLLAGRSATTASSHLSWAR